MRLPWPAPALLVWTGCWLLFVALRGLDLSPPFAFGVAVAAGVALSVRCATVWRRLIVAAGFPLALAASGAAHGLPGWAWLAPLALLALVYPVHAWRDAPLFPTPIGALQGLAQAVPIAAGARVLDGGCGLGAGLRELRREYGQAQLNGIEWSWPLTLACRWRCRFAQVRRGDLWRADWSEFDLVYLFQRPESMARAAAKALDEMRPGAWLESLEFEVSTLAATHVLACADGRRLWLYRIASDPARDPRVSPVAPDGARAARAPGSARCRRARCGPRVSRAG